MQDQQDTFPLPGNELSICQQCLERTVKDTVRTPVLVTVRDAKETTVLYENSDTNILCESDSRFSAIHKHTFTCPNAHKLLLVPG